ncbi:Folic acid synthesis protein fol1 [Hypsizygus marmoreus]|uniref:Folic acid synthesis protein fol1 n=1 Tax=Hypsizygus marmoreus TaxID=39966 RepID=A0A369JIQ5_HYPMA|nr:Folic acid synthesis protein fol1 [Hypsizygus marmoreus]
MSSTQQSDIATGLPLSTLRSNVKSTDTNVHTAAIALGSNLGDRFYNIELALRLLEAPQRCLAAEDIEACGGSHMFCKIVDTSFMYETAPMYFTDQPSFINCACLVESNIPPVIFLRFLKYIESAVGRVPSVTNGPRAVDLDIVLYDEIILDTRPISQRVNLDNLRGELVIPHPRLAEREFVLRPLDDMIPSFIHPIYRKSIRAMLEELPEEDPSMRKVVPFPRYPLLASDDPQSFPVPVGPRTLTYWTYSITTNKRHKSANKGRTQLMATLNATPDSFSDGSTHNTLETALGYARQSVRAGASIIDIGGYSTKPGAAFVSSADEIDRILPIVNAIRNLDSNIGVDPTTDARLRETPISIDTFRSDVARACIQAGANCINDVYAFTGFDAVYPPTEPDALKRAADSLAEMKAVAREFSVPVVLMHSRGDAGQNKEYGMYGDGDEQVIRGVQIELGEKVERIVKGEGGVRRWMVIVDPGIGFSKTLEGNLEVLRGASRVVADVELDASRRNPLRGYPLLIGPSRKSFLGAILSQGEIGRETSPKERVWATAAAVACAVQQGALVVRVHDTKEMVDVLSVAAALWG